MQIVEALLVVHVATTAGLLLVLGLQVLVQGLAARLRRPAVASVSPVAVPARALDLRTAQEVSGSRVLQGT